MQKSDDPEERQKYWLGRAELWNKNMYRDLEHAMARHGELAEFYVHMAEDAAFMSDCAMKDFQMWRRLGKVESTLDSGIWGWVVLALSTGILAGIVYNLLVQAITH